MYLNLLPRSLKVDRIKKKKRQIRQILKMSFYITTAPTPCNNL